MEAEKEIKIILIGAIIGGAIFGVLFYLFQRSMVVNGSVELFPIILAIWMGLCFGGTITFVPFLFKLGWNIFGLWDRLLDFVDNIFSESAHGVLAIIFFLLRLFLGAICVNVWLAVCLIAGPIWPLIRVLMKRSKLKKIQNNK